MSARPLPAAPSTRMVNPRMLRYNPSHDVASVICGTLGDGGGHLGGSGGRDMAGGMLRPVLNGGAFAPPGPSGQGVDAPENGVGMPGARPSNNSPHPLHHPRAVHHSGTPSGGGPQLYQHQARQSLHFAELETKISETAFKLCFQFTANRFQSCAEPLQPGRKRKLERVAGRWGWG